MPDFKRVSADGRVRAAMRIRSSLVALAVLIAAFPRVSAAADLVWKGHTWQVTSGGMAGVCQGDPSNVTVDASGYLHFKISNKNGTWTSSEMFTKDSLGFGTYQWQVDGPIDKYDQNVVLGLFPYGPAAGIGSDGTNEIDIEFSRWGQANGPNADWTDYPNTGKTIGELSFNFTLTSTLSTSRFVWTSPSIQDFLMDGLQPVDGTTGLLKTWTYAPPTPTTNIPQSPMPVGMNLWCFNGPPTNGQAVEIVIRDFQFIPAGASTGAGGGGGAGSGGVGGSAGKGGAGGAVGRGGASGSMGRGGASAGRDGGGASGSNGTGGATGSNGTGGATSTNGTGGAASTNGTGGAAGSNGTGGATGTTAGPASSGGCSCSIVGDGHGWGGLSLGWALFVLARRRRLCRLSSRATS